MSREQPPPPAAPRAEEEEASASATGHGAASQSASARGPSPAAGSPARIPDFFIVGHQKCGTTALYEMLKRHPQIFMPEVKEPRYFVPELLRPGRALSTLDGYLGLFSGARAEQLVGEASPQYIRSRTAAREIAQMQPRARIVVVLREPASFLRSFHMQMVQSDIEPQRDFRKALELVEARRAGRKIPRGCISVEPLLYFDHVRYVEQLQRFHAVLPRERVLVLVYEDFRNDNRDTVGEILSFLGADAGIPIEPVETRPLKAVRSQALRRVADSARTARLHPADASPLGKLIAALTPAALLDERFRAKWRSVVYEKPPPPDPELMRELRLRFKPQVAALSDYLGRDFVGRWGYDQLD
jgi:hypothetical protein